MATSTPNLNLTLPSSGDRVNVEVLNGNFEKLDDRLGGVSDSIIVDDLDPANLVHVTDAAARPAVELISYIEPYQEGSGDPSPDNVRAISGWDSASVTNDTSGQTLTTDLPETVYSGDKYWITGVLMVDSNIATFDGSSAVSLDVASTGMPYISAPLLKDIHPTDRTPICSSHYKIFVNSAPTGEPGIRTLPGGRVFIYDARFTDIDTARAILEAEKPQIVYRIAEPYTIQLTPEQLNLLRGTNNVWSNCGETKLAYVADTKKYIDGKFAALAAAQVGV